MAQVISTNQNTTVSIGTNDETWIINDNVKITVANGYGILESGSGNKIQLFGDVTASGPMYAGVRFQGANSSLLVGKDSVVDGSSTGYGIFYEGAGGRIEIKGEVSGGSEALHGNIWADVTNKGALTGGAGIIFDDAGSEIFNQGSIDVDTVGIASDAASTLISNTAGAKILAGDIGIDVTGMAGDEAVVFNGGLIKSDIAIQDGDDSITLTNRGKIVGDVLLGGGADVFDTRKGSVDGMIAGGDGHDIYKISKSVKITEKAGEGDDTVISSVSYRLTAELDRLTLKGKEDLNGTGNAGDNYVTGNKGDNVLRALNGRDVLDGREGRDQLQGDLGPDSFVFNKGYDKDVIRDYKDGEDHIDCDMILSQQDFDDLNIKQVGADVVINFGDGDVLTLNNLALGKLDYTDFN